MKLTECYNLLLESEDTMSTLKKAIVDHLPVTIQYSGPTDEVLSGPRFNILPVAMGEHFKSGNIVVWAYVTQGTSKKGLPDWKMFRVDRIQNINIDGNAQPFELENIPEYDPNKAPEMLKSLSNVYAHASEIGNEENPEYIEEPTHAEPPTDNEPIEPEDDSMVEPVEPEQEPVEPEEEPVEPEEEPEEFDDSSYYNDIMDDMAGKVNTTDEGNAISRQDYETAVADLFAVKQGIWKEKQRTLGNNPRPGQGSRNTLKNTARQDVDQFLADNGIKINDELLSEVHKRFLELIK
jgi:hypothetical protein